MSRVDPPCLSVSAFPWWSLNCLLTLLLMKLDLIILLFYYVIKMILTWNSFLALYDLTFFVFLCSLIKTLIQRPYFQTER